MNLLNADVMGDDPSRFRQLWAKPKNWHGRGNREWQIASDSTAPMESWSRYTAPTDTLHLTKWAGATAGHTTLCRRACHRGRRAASVLVGRARADAWKQK